MALGTKPLTQEPFKGDISYLNQDTKSYGRGIMKTNLFQFMKCKQPKAEPIVICQSEEEKIRALLSARDKLETLA